MPGVYGDHSSTESGWNAWILDKTGESVEPAEDYLVSGDEPPMPTVEEVIGRSEPLTEDDINTRRRATAEDIKAEPLHGFRLSDEVVRKIVEESSAE